jgi:hypothetical protein
MSFEDRDTVEEARGVIEKIRQELLLGIMGGRKK